MLFRSENYMAIHPTVFDPVLCRTSRGFVNIYVILEGSITRRLHSTVESLTVAYMHISCSQIFEDARGDGVGQLTVTHFESPVVELLLSALVCSTQSA